MPEQNDKAESIGGILPKKVMRLLDALKRTETGTIVHKHISNTLCEHEKNRDTIEKAYAEIIGRLLFFFSNQLEYNPELLAQLKIIRLGLTPPLSLHELDVLREFIDNSVQSAYSPAGISDDEFQEAIQPLLEAFGFVTSEQPRERKLKPPAQIMELDKNKRQNQQVTEDFNHRKVEYKVDSAFRKHLETQRDEFQRIEQEFAKTITHAIKQSNAFTSLLDQNINELTSLEAIEENEELEMRRQNIIREIQNIRNSHQEYLNGFSRINKTIQELDAGNRQLDEELNRVRLLSMTDDLTGLHNRRAFQQRLKEEIGRADRYQTPLTVIIMDLDEFKSINDAHGHRVGDLVLKLYSTEVFSIFRQHDMVTRYGGEEFAVILPNTDAEGGLRAISKVKRKVNKVVCKYQDIRFGLPTFSAGLAQYHPGEDVSDFVHRADTAMYLAKSKGRNLVEEAIVQQG